MLLGLFDSDYNLSSDDALSRDYLDYFANASSPLYALLYVKEHTDDYILSSFLNFSFSLHHREGADDGSPNQRSYEKSESAFTIHARGFHPTTPVVVALVFASQPTGKGRGDFRRPKGL